MSGGVISAQWAVLYFEDPPASSVKLIVSCCLAADLQMTRAQHSELFVHATARRCTYMAEVRRLGEGGSVSRLPLLLAATFIHMNS